MTCTAVMRGGSGSEPNERTGDPAKGTLTSVPFVVSKPFASFLIGGGSHAGTCVELVKKDGGQVVFRGVR